VESVTNPGLTCGNDPTPPALKGLARAGAKVTVQWSGIVRTHYGPIMSVRLHKTFFILPLANIL